MVKYRKCRKSNGVVNDTEKNTLLEGYEYVERSISREAKAHEVSRWNKIGYMVRSVAQKDGSFELYVKKGTKNKKHKCG